MTTRSTWPFSFSLLLLVVVACARGVDSEDEHDATLPARKEPSAAPATDPTEAGSVAAEPSIDVRGSLVDERGVAIVGRPVVLLDAREVHIERMTDEGGGFFASGVRPPYDVADDPAPTGVVVARVAYLGIHRSDPRIVLEERANEERLSRTLPVMIDLPPCRGPTSCWVAIQSASASGEGSYASTYEGDPPPTSIDIEHRWSGFPSSGNDALEQPVCVHALVGDAAYTEYAYARGCDVVLTADETRGAFEALVPQFVETTTPVVVSAQTTDALTDWAWSATATIDIGDATLPLARARSPVARFRLPLLAGAAWRLTFEARRPFAEDPSDLTQSTETATGSLALTGASLAVPVAAPAAPIRPEPGGSFSRRARALTWSERPSGLASVTVTDESRARVVFRAFTSEPRISLFRLERLGIGALHTGAHWIERSVTLGATIDQRVDPDAEDVRSRFGPRSRHRTTYERFRFRVTE